MIDKLMNKEIDLPIEDDKVEALAQQTPVAAANRSERPKTSFNRDNRPGAKNFRDRKKRFTEEPKKSEYEEAVVNIARVTKVVKGGRRFSFSATVVVGNKNGKVGLGHGKANEVPDAIKKAIKDATKNVINVPIMDGRTVPHESVSKFLASKVWMKPAPKGKGIIASGSVRMVVELAGYKDVYTKTFGSRSKQNVVRATIQLLEALRTPKEIAALRDKTVEQLLGR